MFIMSQEHKNNIPVIRIKEIYLENFKNVKKGTILCESGRRYIEQGTEPDIVGIYGQNGSGKTSVIQAISLLKDVISGKSLYDYYSNYINVDSENAFLSFAFDLQYKDNKKREVIYSFRIAKKNQAVLDRTFIKAGFLDGAEKLINSDIGVRVFDECIQMSGDFFGKKIKKQTIIDTSMADSNYPFGPSSKREYFVNDENKNILIGNKISTEKINSSFIFEDDTLEAFSKVGNSVFFEVLEEIAFFARKKLFIISTANYGIIQSSKCLPLYTQKNTLFNLSYYSDLLTDEYRFSQEDFSKILDYIDDLPIIPTYFPLLMQTPINKRDYLIIENEIKRISIVLSSVIPNTGLFLKKRNETIDQQGNESVYVELMITKDGTEMPLLYESDGTIKIIGMLSCLIMAFNDKSITVAIDELDSGVFEYLLGELLQVFEEGGRGQLFFTSHNLRPLEVLDKKYLYFTTTDVNNRYVHLKNIGKTNNLRNVYFREILEMEGDDIKLYSGTQKYKLAAAFRKAGFDE